MRARPCTPSGGPRSAAVSRDQPIEKRRQLAGEGLAIEPAHYVQTRDEARERAVAPLRKRVAERGSETLLVLGRDRPAAAGLAENLARRAVVHQREHRSLRAEILVKLRGHE